MKLKTGDIVLIISPAGRVCTDHITNAVKILNDCGLIVELGQHVNSQYQNFSGTIEQRLLDLQWALDHSTAKAIFCSRGGYGLLQLLEQIDWTCFIEHPKLLIGYSDVTNLQIQVNNKGIDSLHALMPNSFPLEGEPQESLESLKSVLFNTPYSIEWKPEQCLWEGEIEGDIVGGNLSIIYSLLGTPFSLNTQGKILFLEDVSEYIYHIDRMLRSLQLAGIFSNIRALIVGDFTDIKDNNLPFGKTIQELFTDISKKYNIPVVLGLKVGHGDQTLALPLGRKGKLKVSQGSCSLKFS